MASDTLNLVEGDGVAIVLAESEGCIDIAIGAGPMAEMPVPAGPQTLVGPRRALNFIEGEGVRITVEGQAITIALA